MRQLTAANVRIGSKADMTASVRDVRYYPENGHQNTIVECPLWATTGHVQCNMIAETLKAVSAVHDLGAMLSHARQVSAF
jgi:hypothetical protein